MGLDGTDNRQAAPVARRCPNPPSGAPEPGRAQRPEGEGGAVAASADPGCTTPPPQTSRSAHSGRSEALAAARRARHRRRPWRTGPAARKKENERGGGDGRERRVRGGGTCSPPADPPSTTPGVGVRAGPRSARLSRTCRGGATTRGAGAQNECGARSQQRGAGRGPCRKGSRRSGGGARARGLACGGASPPVKNRRPPESLVSDPRPHPFSRGQSKTIWRPRPRALARIVPRHKMRADAAEKHACRTRIDLRHWIEGEEAVGHTCRCVDGCTVGAHRRCEVPPIPPTPPTSPPPNPPSFAPPKAQCCHGLLQASHWSLSNIFLGRKSMTSALDSVHKSRFSCDCI